MSYKFTPFGKVRPMTPEELAEADADSYIVVYYYNTDEHGTPYWLCLAIKPSLYAEFMHRVKTNQSVRFKDYGDILRYGQDEEIPDDVRQEMKEKHGCHDNYVEFLAQDIKNAEALYQKNEDKRIGDIVAMLKQKSH